MIKSEWFKLLEYVRNTPGAKISIAAEGTYPVILTYNDSTRYAYSIAEDEADYLRMWLHHMIESDYNRKYRDEV